MIISRTPLRISFAGGGTDLASFYELQAGGVLSTTINKYLYVTVKSHGNLFDEKYRLNYSISECVESVDEIKNEIARECIRFLLIEPPIYISTVADIPASSGLGSSSSFAVGLLNALHALRGERVSAGQLADEASHIEINVLNHPIGKQDQYITAFGGLNFIRFLPDGSVSIEPLQVSDKAISCLFGNILIFWTGITRSAITVLYEQKQNTSAKMSELTEMGKLAEDLRVLVRNGFDVQVFGDLLDRSWKMKRKLASGITTDVIDDYYERARAAGSLGGKICGAGGGGFLLLIVPQNRQDSVRNALSMLNEVHVGYETHGSELIYG